MRLLGFGSLGLAAPFLLLSLVRPLAAQQNPESLAEALQRLGPVLTKPQRALLRGQRANGRLDEGDSFLSNESYVELWTYEGQAGEQVVFEMNSPAFDALLILTYDAGNGLDPIAHDDDGGGNYDARLATRLPATGSYVLLATSSLPRQRGPYSLLATPSAASDVPADRAPAEPEVAALQRSAPVTGSFSGGESRLHDGRPYDLWRFEGRRGERIRFAVEGVPATVFIARRLGGGAVPVAGKPENNGAAVLVDLPASGTYLVGVAASEPTARGSYRLRADIAGEATLSPLESPSLRTAPTHPTDPDEPYALLVGIDDYPGAINDLPSSVSDVHLMKRVLVEQYGFAEDNVLLLLDRQATREQVIVAFEQHLGLAGPDGIAVFYYSGHGTQLDGNLGLTGAADPEEDGRDEALVLWGREGHASILLDDELGALMDRLAAGRTLAILDACHSGTGSRGNLVKAVTPESIGAALHVPEPYEQVTSKAVSSTEGSAANGAGGLLDHARGEMRHLLLAATRPEEYALARQEPWPGGQIASAFTYFLAAGLEAAEDGTTFSDLMTRVGLLTSQYARGEGSRQTPQLEGPTAAVTLGQFLTRQSE